MLYMMLGASVAIANILLNSFTSQAVAETETWLNVIGTRAFGLAFLTGTVSLLLMTALYHVGRQSSFGMANGILLMGGLSICGGTIVGYVLKGNTVHWSEWTLMTLILVFIAVRYSIAAQIYR